MKRFSSRAKEQSISETTYYSTMSHHQDTKSPTASPAEDIQMGNTIDIYHPETWE
jgi:hypothetical protein